MGWRAVTISACAVSALLSCTEAPSCLDAFWFQGHVSGGAHACVATFSHGGTSLAVSVADLDGGCGSSTDTLQTVTCTSELPPDVLVCQRGCFTTEPDLLWIHAPDPAPIHELFGNPPVSDQVSVVVECNGSTVLSTDAAVLETCPM